MPDGYTAVVGRMSYHEPGHVAHHFDDAVQQKESAMLGMWAFLCTEVLFFGPVGHWKWLLALGGYSVLQFLAAYWLFDRLRDSFAEAV